MRRWLVAVLLCLLVSSAVFAYLLIPHCIPSPKIGVFYYVWYSAPDSGNWNTSLTVVDYPVYPLLGNYSSSNSTVIKQQLVLMKDLGVNFVVISWWGCNENDSYGQFIDNSTREVFQVAKDNGIDLKFAIMVEPYSKNDGSYNFTEIYNHIYDNFVSPYSSLYYTEEKPLLFFFARADNDSLTDNGTLPPDTNGTRFKTILVGQTDYVQWEYTNLNYHVEPKRVPYTDEISVTPRFDDSRVPNRTATIVDPNLTQGVYDQEWANATKLWKDGVIDTIMITSWNEYPERTAIEPHYDATAINRDPYLLYNKTKDYINQIHQLSIPNQPTQPQTSPSPTLSPTPTATPSASPTPTTTPSPKNEWIGISTHSLSANEAQLVNESGARWIRVDASDDFGIAVTNAKEHNLKVLGILDSWMFNQSITFTLEERRDAVTHYVSQYSNVDAWEIWNEPANPNYTLSVEKYYSMVQIASPIIRQYDPSAKIVLFGGLNLWSGGDPNLALDKEFAQQLAAMNIEQYGDAISVHAYPWMDQVQPWIWEKYDESLTYYRGLFTSNKTLEIWVTETGQPIEAGGEQGQAQYMADTLQHFQGKVTLLFWYSLVDNAADAADQKSFGLIGNATTPRPAYYVLQKQLTPQQLAAANYLESHFNETVGLIYESEDKGIQTINGFNYSHNQIYYIYSDNLLAEWALKPYELQISNKINQTIQSNNIPPSKFFEVLFGNPIPINMSNATQLVIKQYSDRIILVEFHNSSTPLLWDQYGDTLIYQSLNSYLRGNKTGAEYYFNKAYKMWDGKGINDSATQDDGKYANFKLALILYASKVLNLAIGNYTHIEEQLWSMQQVNGGITSYADLSGSPIGSANAETTAMALLPYNNELVSRMQLLFGIYK